MSSRVLCVDPGLASCGAGVLEVRTGGRFRVLEGAVIRTAPSAKRQNVHAQSDIARRLGEVANALQRLVAEHSPGFVVAEGWSLPRGASAAAKVAASHGAIAGVAAANALPVLTVAPQDLKEHLAGRKNATKREIIDAVARFLPDLHWPSRTTDWEHLADALGAGITCVHTSPELRAACALALGA